MWLQANSKSWESFAKSVCQLDHKFKEAGVDAHLVLTMHDEMVVEVKEDEVEVVQGIVEDCLRDGFKEFVPEMPFELDIKIAEFWGN